MIKKRIVAITLVIALFLSSVVNFNTNIGFAADKKMPLNITMVKDDKEVEVTFNSLDEKLGLKRQGTDLNWPGRSDWTYRTYRKIFLGWSPTKDYTGDVSQKIYRDTDTIGTVIKDLGTKNIKLYQIFISQVQLQNLTVDALAKGQLGINHNRTALSTLYDKATIKEEKGFDSTSSKSRELTAYYDEAFEDKIPVNLEANFRFTDSRVPLIVIENPLNVIDYAEDIKDFSGEKPTTYTYEDLIVELDPELEVSTEMNNLVVTSPLYRVAAVLDENYNVLESTITRPTNGSLDTKFSFKNPNKKKKFIVRCVIRNFGANYGNANEKNVSSTVTSATAEQVFSMYLTSGDKGNVWIPKEKAKKYAENGSKFVTFGRINGFMKLNKPNVGGIMGMHIGIVFRGLNSQIATKRDAGDFNIKSSNDVVIKFVDHDEKDLEYKIIYIADETLEYGKQVVKQEGKVGKQVDGKTTEDPINKIIRVGVKPKIITEKIPFETIRKENPNMLEGTEKVIVEGKEGSKVVTTGYELDEKTGKVTPKKPVETIIEKINKVIEFGTKKIEKPVAKITTSWVDESSNALKEPVTGKKAEKKGTIEGYTFVKTTIDKKGNVTHIFKENKYKVSYIFTSETKEKQLPTAINDYLPKDILNLKNGAIVKPILPTKKEVIVKDGKWIFKGYDKQELKINKSDDKFVGVWVFVENKYTTNWVDEKGKVLKDPVTDKTTKEAGTIKGYTFVKTTTDENGNVTHIFKKVVVVVEKEYTTNWVDEKGKAIKDPVTDKTTKEAGTIKGYTFVKTTTDENGNVTHIFKKVVVVVENKYTTNWVDENGKKLKESVTAKSVQPRGEIKGYEFVGKNTDKNGNVTYIFKKSKEDKKELPKTGSSSNTIVYGMLMILLGFSLVRKKA